MRADPRFLSRSARFWAHAKYISEKLKYSDRSQQLRTYEPTQVVAALRDRNLTPDNDLLKDVLEYLNWRALKLNRDVAPLFMNREEAAKAFEDVRRRIRPTKLHSMNKQKGDKHHPSYLSSIVGMIAESVVGPDGFVDDTQNLTILTWDGNLEEIFSRRFDGALPSTENPKAVWEIKEYYGTTTFGSRVSGGVYETLLDGYEVEGVRSRHKRNRDLNRCSPKCELMHPYPGISEALLKRNSKKETRKYNVLRLCRLMELELLFDRES